MKSILSQSEINQSEPASVSAASVLSPFPIQAKLTIGGINDHYEQEADQTADRIMRMPEPSYSVYDRSGINNIIQRKCAHCEKEEKAQLKPLTSFIQMKSDFGNTEVSGHVSNQISSAKGGGNPMNNGTRSFMESRFGSDFSSVRIHSDSNAIQLSRELNARAFTVGSDVFFNEGEYAPDSSGGRHLLAHELTHTIQQGRSPMINRCANPKKNDPIYDELVKSVKKIQTYIDLSPDDKVIAEEVFTEAKKKPSCLYHLEVLQTLFKTKVKPPGTISVETKQSTVKAAAQEKVRVAKPVEAKNLDIEKKAENDPSRKWDPVKGKYGGGTYYVDKSNAKNIVVKAKIFLRKEGTGAQSDIDAIKQMQDGIEKAASKKGYIVSITFVNDTTDPDTFTVGVDPSKWETATNWSGGEPLGYAHELHHMFAFELDRYNYFDHATNESMEISDRLYWFAQELTKPAGYNDPTSIMNDAAHPNDDDVCRVAGLDLKSCLEARKKM